MSITRSVETPARREAGFNLIELMVTLTIGGILLMLAVPSFTKMIKDNRRATIVNELNFTVMSARAEAAKRGQPVTICGLTSSGGLTCSGGGTWDYGWVAFVDVNQNGAIDNNVTVNGTTYDETQLVLRQFRSDYSSKIKVRSNAAFAGASGGAVVMMPFNQTGTLASLLVCDDRGSAEARVVCVGANGRAASQTTDCTTGAALVCP